MNQVAYLHTNTNSVSGPFMRCFNDIEAACNALRELGYFFKSILPTNSGGGECELWVKEVEASKPAHLCSVCHADSVAECDAEGCGVLRLNGHSEHKQGCCNLWCEEC